MYILAYYWYFYKDIYNINERNLIKFPRFVVKTNIFEVKTNVKSKILLSGSITNNYYPMRKYVSELKHQSIDRLNRGSNITGENYINFLVNIYVVLLVVLQEIHHILLINFSKYRQVAVYY